MVIYWISRIWTIDSIFTFVIILHMTKILAMNLVNAPEQSFLLKSEFIFHEGLKHPYSMSMFNSIYWLIMYFLFCWASYVIYLCQVHEKLPIMDRSMLRTLKDHLYQCPSKLSEEMVRCMAAVYCWLRGAASVNPEKNRSPLLSRSSTNVILPRRSIGEDQEWSCKSMVEISWISTDKSQFARASYAINNYR